MSQTQASGRSEIDLRIKEAETCYGMGMLEEALSLYELVIASGKQLPAQTHQVLAEKVGRLKKEIQDHQDSEKKGLSAEDISIFKKTLSAQADIPTLLDGAAALKELGLMEEAAAEFEKLLQVDPAACDSPNRIARPARSSATISAASWKPRKRWRSSRKPPRPSTSST